MSAETTKENGDCPAWAWCEACRRLVSAACCRGDCYNAPLDPLAFTRVELMAAMRKAFDAGWDAQGCDGSGPSPDEITAILEDLRP